MSRFVIQRQDHSTKNQTDFDLMTYFQTNDMIKKNSYYWNTFQCMAWISPFGVWCRKREKRKPRDLLVLKVFRLQENNVINLQQVWIISTTSRK